MTDRPILFSAPMVIAIASGRKSQTRRLLNPQPIGFDPFDLKCKPRYRAGDRLWIREAWRSSRAYDDLAPSEMGGEEPLRYDADSVTVRWTSQTAEPGRRRAGMHMPRWASRLTLTVTEVRVQRLQEINLRDVLAEGIQIRQISLFGADAEQRDAIGRIHFKDLWDSLNAKRAPWDSNPFVLATTFSTAKRNIDQATAS